MMSSVHFFCAFAAVTCILVVWIAAVSSQYYDDNIPSSTTPSSTTTTTTAATTSSLFAYLPDANGAHNLTNSTITTISSSSITLPSRTEVFTTLLDLYRNHQNNHNQNNHNHNNDSTHNRHLQTSSPPPPNFSTLNRLLSEITLRLPSATVSSSGLDITISRIRCTDLNVRDVRLAHAVESATSHRLALTLSGIRLQCQFRWEYEWTVFKGRGDGYAKLNPASGASVGLQFTSENYDTHPPHDAGVSHCSPNIQIETMDFDGDGLGIIGGILNLFEGLLRDTVEDELERTVCGELRGLGEDAFDDLLERLSDELEDYLVPLEDSLADPLYLENTIELPMMMEGGENDDDDESVSYINFQQFESYAGEWIESALHQFDSFLGASHDSDSDSTTLGINKFIRDNLLAARGELTLDDPTQFLSSNVVFEGHDMVTQTIITVQSITVWGLDSFQSIDLLNAIGRYTLNNVLVMDYLYVEMEMEAEMKASSKSNAVVVAPDSEPVVEKFSVGFGASGIEIDASLFLGIHAETLGNLELGSMLRSRTVVPCLLSAIDVAQFTGLSASVTDIIPPELEGFIDGGIDRLLSEGAEALFEMYENALMKAVPNFFETYVRDALNDFIEDALDAYRCPTADDDDSDRDDDDDDAGVETYVDFRDAFLSKADAELAGGAGDGRLGNVLPWVVNVIEDQLFSASADNNNGLLAINDMLIGPLTKSQSGEKGALKLNGTLVDINKKEVTGDYRKAFAHNWRMTLSDLSITGLDTFRSPIKVLDPRTSTAHLLENQLNLGMANKPLDASIRFGMEVGGASSPIATNNVMDLRVSMPSVEIFAVIFATVRESRFTKFPLKDILNFSCWLSMIPVSTIGVDYNVGLAMHYLDVVLGNNGGILAKTSCVSCSNSWLEDLDSIVEFLDGNQFISGLKSRALSIASDLLKGDWVQGMVDKQILAASQRCPHDDAFGSILPERAYPTFKATRDAVDGILYMAFPLAQVAAVVIAQTHSNLEIPSPVDMVLDVPEDANLIDLTDLSSVGGWADMALEEARNYLGGTMTESNDLGITSMLRWLILDDNNSLTIPIEGKAFEAGGITLSFQDVTVIGLDSFTIFDVLKASGPNSVNNSVKLQRLGATLTMCVVVEDESSDQAQMLLERGFDIDEIMETITVSLILKDVELDVSLLMAIDQDLVGELKLGSISNTDHIFSCLLSTIHSIGLSQFVMDIGDIEEFSIAGFISEDTNKSIQNMTEAILAEYKPMMLGAIPALTSNTIRPILHNMMQVFVDDIAQNDGCPEPDSSLNGILDFRDLLFSEGRALELLGRGDSPYGDLFSLLYGYAEDLLFSAGEDGLSKMNGMLIDPLTKSQSGVEGELKLNGTLLDLNKEEVELDIWKAFADNLRLTLSDLSITGLGTLRGPIEALKPRSTSAHLLDNQLSLGTPNTPLDASVRFGIEVGGTSSPLATNNVIDLQLSMPSMDVAAVVFATVQESRFMNFPLKDILNFSCWLSTIPLSGKTASIDVGLAMHHLHMLFDEGILAKTACVSCSNSWLKDLDSIINFLDENQFISGLKTRALSIASVLLKGDWVQGMIDKQIVAASQRCPHDSASGSLVSDQTYPTFRGSRDLVDGILYTAFPLVQVIAVVLAQKHSNLEVGLPVYVELDVPDGAKLIDLTDLSSVAGWADMALEEVRNYLGGTTESNDLGITSMLQSMALDGNGLLKIPIEDEGFEAGGVKLSLYDVTMVGLDSFTLFDVLKASDQNRFSNSIRLQKMGVVLNMGLSVEGEVGPTDNKMETITVSLILKDVELNVSLLMAMDQDLMGELKLGSILDTTYMISCLLSTIHSVGLSEFVMDIGDIEEFSISGFISEDTNESIQVMTEAILSEYKPLVLSAIPAFTSKTIRPILHGILQVFVDTTRNDGACPEPDSSLDGILDFRDLLLSGERALELLGRGGSPYGDLFRLLYNFLEEMMSKADKNGLSELNVLLSSLTERQSDKGGELYYPGDLFKQDLDVALNGLNAAIELGVSDLRVSNIDSFGAPVKVLQPVKEGSSLLNNTALMGFGPDPFRTEFRLLIKGKGDEVEVHNDLVLGLNLENVGILLQVLVQIAAQPFLNFPLQDALNLQCWLATVITPVLDKYGIRDGEPDSGIVLKSLALAVAEARLDIECISCSSPLIVEMSSKVGSSEAVEDTTAVANMLFEYLTKLLGGDFVQSGLDKMLNEAAMKCPHSPSYNQNFPGLKYEELVAPEKSEDSYGFLIAIFIVMAISAVAVIVIFVAAKCVSRRRHNRWVKTLNRPQKLELENMQNDEREREKDLNSRMSSLVKSKEVPLFIRLFIPIVIIGNIALFLSGHLSLGGTVNISGTFAGQEFDVDGFFEFSMAKSTIEMWNAGATALAILIVIFSGVWPYSKLLVTLFIWFAPPRWLTSNRRGKLLHWLDVLGKWSMIDVFVLLMTLASFRLSVESPSHLSFLPESLYSINMLVVPLWGLYANMLAQFVAQISSHVIIHYHRKTAMAAVHSQEIDWDMVPANLDNSPEILRAHMFKLDYEASSKRATVRSSANWILSAALLSFVILVICGCALPSFGIEVLGLVGLVVESGNQFDQAHASYSVFGLATMIIDQARYLNTASDLVGLGTLASLLVITVFLVPLAQAASLIAQWFAPMTKKQRMRNTVLNEILDAWQYMEVYVLAIIIAAWQLGGVSEYMINAYCDPLKSTFTSLSYYGILSQDDAQCFRVDATVASASWILVAASLILCILNHFIVGASCQKAQDGDIPAERRLHTDRRWLQSSKQSTVMTGVDVGMMSMTMSISNDDEEVDGSDNNSDHKDASVSPVKPRFTDYYFFVTTHRAEEPVQEHEAETAMLTIDENRSDE